MFRGGRNGRARRLLRYITVRPADPGPCIVATVAVHSLGSPLSAPVRSAVAPLTNRRTPRHCSPDDPPAAGRRPAAISHAMHARPRPALRRSAAILLLAALAAAVRCDGPGAGAGGQQYPFAGGQQSPFAGPTGAYVSTYDHLDVNRLLKNDKLVNAYIKCFLGEGHCTADARQAKAYLLPEIISTVCSKCSPRQKVMARQVLTHIYKTRPNEFNRIMAIYDKDNKYGEIMAFMRS